MPARRDGTSEVIEHQIRVAAPPETVFAYFTDPVRIVQWLGEQATLDPRPGGVFRVVFQPPQPVVERLWEAFGGDREQPPERLEEVAVVGRFLGVDPPRHIAFTWGFESEPSSATQQSTAVEVSLTTEGQETLVHLVHRGLPPEALAFHRAGWEHYLPRLATVAAGRDPGARSWPDPEKVT